MRRFGSAMLWCLCLLAAQTDAGCSKPIEHTAVVVHVSDLDAETATLRATVTLNEAPGTLMPGRELPARSTLVLELPAMTTGTLSLRLDAISSARYILATATKTIDVAPKTIAELAISLKRTEYCPKTQDPAASWCLQSPIPRADTLNAVWAFADNDVWAAGNRGWFQTWNGDLWSDLAPPAAAKDELLSGIWAFARSDVWMSSGSSSAAHHWDGSKWKSYSGVPVRRLWGPAPNDVWGVGSGGGSSIFHWDGTNWMPLTAPAGTGVLFGVWGSDASHVWMVGEAASGVYWDGSTLTRLPTNATEMHAVWAAPSSGTAWAAGRVGTIQRCTAPCAQWISEPKLTDEYLYDIAGAASDDIWAVGDRGTILHWDGSQWKLRVAEGISSTLQSVRVRSANDVWIAGEGGTVLHWDGVTIRRRSGGIPSFNAIWGKTANDIWAVGRAGAIYHYDGSVWRPSSAGVDNELTGIWGSSSSSENDLWVVGHGVLLHGDGKQWQKLESPLVPVIPTDIPTVWAQDRKTVVVALRSGEYLNFDGSVWTVKQSGLTTDIRALDGTGPNNIWAAAVGGTVAQWDGVSWTNRMAPAPSSTVQVPSIRVFSESDVWLAADGQSKINHWNGSGWQPLGAVGVGGMSALGGASAGELWLAGDSQKLARYVGGQWLVSDNGAKAAPFGSNAPCSIRKFFSFDANQIWAVGDGGLIMHRKPN